MRNLLTLISVFSLVNIWLCLQVFFSFAHTQLYPDIACSEKVSAGVDASIREEYLAQCEKVGGNIEHGMNVALDYSGIIAILSLFVFFFAYGIFVIAKRERNNA